MDLRNKKVTVVGLGNSGIGSALLLEKEGAIVSVTDNSKNEDIRKNAKLLEEKYIDLEIAKHTESFLHDTELLVVSPGVEKTSLPIRYARENNIPLISELELGYHFCKGRIVAVTGTNGKSTVVSLLGEILRNAKFPVSVCGNIGNSLSGEVEHIKKGTVVVLETSSFQLEWIAFFRPKISVMLNIAEDHLDRYSDFKTYFDAKKRIFKNQRGDDITILNYDDKNLQKLGKTKKMASHLFHFSRKKRVEGIYLDKNAVKISLRGKTKELFTLGDSTLKGEHNLENILASALAATLLGARPDAIEKVVKVFKPLAHRFENIATIGGIEFIDDSKATNVDSTRRALESLQKPAVLIAGGKDKNLSYGKILPALKKNVKKIVLIGETRRKMRNLFEKLVKVEEKDSLEEAVLAAYESAPPKGCVLLSPMCSSFDMFDSYKERGEIFKKTVRGLKAKG
ncbi:MAG: UDP-N-acetylmuramoyl-L-alanine--D-glutamate ligase [Candidatus Omnitrophica bacterium]|nr:UDP-N-acetylmuramoyl-L-alanine--D-glutamate ligase [Candidatus Omnitrophota bacterium]